MPRELLTERATIQAGLASGTSFKPYGSIRLAESAEGVLSYKISGVFQNCECVNLNNRRYRRHLWETNFLEGSSFRKHLDSRHCMGLIEHPEDGLTKLTEVSHLITEVRFATPQEIAESAGKLVEGDILGSLEILNTPHGQVLRALTEAGIPWGVSSRGNGTCTKNGDFLDVNEDFLLETWDAVFVPSVERAIPSMVEQVYHRAPSQLRESLQTILKEAHAAAVEPPIFTLQMKSLGESPVSLTKGADGRYVLPGLDIGTFGTVQEAMTGVADYITLRENRTPAAAPAPAPAAPTKPEDEPIVPAPAPPLPESAQPVNPPPTAPTPKMSKLAEAKTLRADVTRLTQTLLKGLKPSGKSALFESVDDLRVRAGALLAEDATVKPILDPLLESLTKFADRLDESDEMAPPAPGGPPAPAAPAAPDAPIEGEEGNGASTATTMLDAADALRAAADGTLDAEQALSLADALEAAADTVGGGDVPVEGEPFEDIEVPSDMSESGRRCVGRLQRRLKINESRTSRLNAATTKLLEKTKAQRKSNLTESAGESAAEYKKAATQIAETYNTDMVALGCKFFEATQPELYKANKKRLQESLTWEDLQKSTNSLLEEKNKRGAGTPRPPVAPKVTESAAAPGAAPAVPPATPVAEPLHESVLMAQSMKRKRN